MHARRLIALLAALLLAAGSASAACRDHGLLDALGDDARARIDAAEAGPHARGLIWRASRGERTVLVVGTLHLDDPRLGAVMARVRPLLEEADLVMLEATGEELERVEALAAEEPERLFLLDEPTLVERLAPEEWVVVSEAALEAGIPGFMAAQFRPFYLLLAISVPPCAMEGLVAGRPGLDLLIEGEADALGIPARALEPFDTVIDVFEEMDEADALALLVSTARAGALVEASTATLLDLYFEERTAATIALNEAVVARMPDLSGAEREVVVEWFDEALLGARNRAWLPRIEEAARPGGPVMVAVGAAHLPGEEGVLSLLAEAGWRVEPVAAP